LGGADDKAETEHLLALAAGAREGRLRIFRGDLLDGAALMDAARGCSGVFHLASPCIVDAVSDPQVCAPWLSSPLLFHRLALPQADVRLFRLCMFGCRSN
jgi:hypothetical protein